VKNALNLIAVRLTVVRFTQRVPQPQRKDLGALASMAGALFLLFGTRTNFFYRLTLAGP
jgi:hypothetical protein